MGGGAGDRAKFMWRMKVQSAIRTSIACTIIGCTTLYGPSRIRSAVTFPAFSYLTAILIVSDANLGDTIKGCCHAFYAILQVVPLSILSIIVLRQYYYYMHSLSSSEDDDEVVVNVNAGLAAFMVVINSFLVGLPESTPLLAKRIGFGQIVILFVDIVNHGNYYFSNGMITTIIMLLPLRVASSTALGALSSLLALSLPFPRLACSQVRNSISLLYSRIFM